MGRKITWTDEKMAKAVGDNISIRGVLSDIGLDDAGGNYQTVKDAVKRMGLDTSHWMGQAHLRGKKHNWSKKKSLDEFLIRGAKISRGNLKRRLLAEGLLKNKCAICGQGPEWKGEPLVMVFDHTNGENNDYRIENLRLLCPNCNSQQDTFCSRNKERHNDQMVLNVVGKRDVKGAAEELGYTVGALRNRLSRIRGRAGVGKRA